MNPLVALSLAVLLLAPASASAAHDDAWVDEQVAALQPTAADRRIDDIGWARNVLEARRLAATHHRPIFLFTHDGRMAIGRC